MNGLNFLNITAVMGVIGTIIGVFQWLIYDNDDKKSMDNNLSMIMDGLILVHQWKILLNNNEGFILYDNQLIFKNSHNNLQEKDSIIIYNHNKIQIRKIIDEYNGNNEINMKNIPVIYNNNDINPLNNPTKENFNGINYFNDPYLLIILDKNYNIKHYENPQEIFFSPNNYNNFQDWWHNLMDENIVNNNSFKDVMESIALQNNYLLVTLNDRCYSVGTFNDNDYIFVKFQEVTQEINAKSDLQNNGQLIDYLMESFNSPMIIFNKNQKVEFINEKTKEILGNLNNYSLQEVTNLLKNHYKITENNQWIIHNNYYQLQTKIIGNFICWIMISIENPQKKNHQNNIKFSMDKEIELMNNIIKNIDNEDQFQILKNISQKIVNSFNKNNYNFSYKQNYSIKKLINSINTNWINQEKITIINKIDEDILIDYNLKNIIHWMIGDLIKLSTNITLEFLHKDNKLYINLKLLGTPSYWSSYQNQVMDYIHKNYNYLIENTGGNFHNSIKNYQPLFQIIFPIPLKFKEYIQG